MSTPFGTLKQLDAGPLSGPSPRPSSTPAP